MAALQPIRSAGFQPAYQAIGAFRLDAPVLLRASCQPRYFSLLGNSILMALGFRSRGYLPHLESDGAPYFVTFRLAHTLPRDVVVALKERRTDLLQRAATGAAMDIDRLLDGASGEAWLREPRIAQLVAGALRRFAGDRYRLFAWVVMPNHVHAVVQPLGHTTLSATLHSWKSYTGTEANRILSRAGRPFWQRESYDHLIRSQRDFDQCCAYTEENPVRAGLCPRAEDWRWSSAKPGWDRKCSQDGCATFDP